MIDADDYLSLGRTPEGKPLWRVRFLARLAKFLDIQFKIGGQPYGASFERALNHTGLRKQPWYRDRVRSSTPDLSVVNQFA